MWTDHGKLEGMSQLIDCERQISCEMGRNKWKLMLESATFCNLSRSSRLCKINFSHWNSVAIRARARTSNKLLATIEPLLCTEFSSTGHNLLIAHSISHPISHPISHRCTQSNQRNQCGSLWSWLHEHSLFDSSLHCARAVLGVCWPDLLINRFELSCFCFEGSANKGALIALFRTVFYFRPSRTLRQRCLFDQTHELFQIRTDSNCSALSLQLGESDTHNRIPSLF